MCSYTFGHGHAPFVGLGLHVSFMQVSASSQQDYYDPQYGTLFTVIALVPHSSS